MGDGGKKRFVIDPHSPYYLHLLEGPDITVVIFDGKNYDLWVRAVRAALKSNNKLAFIESMLKRPIDEDGERFSEA